MARMRSPNYPSISLSQAINFTDKIFSADRTNIIDKAVAAEHMGYTSLNGRTLKLLGALSQYGLLDKVGKGKVRVSTTAVSILHGADESEKRDAILSAATSPSLFKSIRENFDNPSDATITSFLMREGFTDAAVDPVLKSYSDTNAFLTSQGVSESHGNADKLDADSNPEDNKLDQENDNMGMHEPLENKPKMTPEVSFEKVALDFNFSSSGLAVKGSTNSPSELNAFIERLKALAALLPEDETED